MSHSKAIKSTQLYVDNDAMSWVTHVEEASGTNSQADDDNESDNDASSEMSFETCFSQDSNAGEDGDESLMYEIPRGFFPDPEVAFEISGQHSEDDSKDESEVESFCFCELDLDKEDNPEGGHESKRGRMKNVDEHPPTFAHDSNEETGVNVKNNIAKMLAAAAVRPDVPVPENDILQSLLNPRLDSTLPPNTSGSLQSTNARSEVGLPHLNVLSVEEHRDSFQLLLAAEKALTTKLQADLAHSRHESIRKNGELESIRSHCRSGSQKLAKLYDEVTEAFLLPPNTTATTTAAVQTTIESSGSKTVVVDVGRVVELEKTIVELKEQKALLEEKVKEGKMLMEKQAEEWMALLLEVQAEQKRLQSGLVRMQEASEKLQQAVRAEVDVLKGELEKATKEKESLRCAASECEVKMSQMVGSLEGEVSALKVKLERAVNDHEEEMKTRQRTNEEYRLEMSKKLDSSKAQNARDQDDISKFRQQNSDLLNEMQKMDRTITHMTREREAHKTFLREELAQVKAGFIAAQKDLAVCKHDEESLKAKIVVLTHDLELEKRRSKESMEVERKVQRTLEAKEVQLNKALEDLRVAEKNCEDQKKAYAQLFKGRKVVQGGPAKVGPPPVTRGDDQVATGQGQGPVLSSHPQPSTSPVATGPGQSPALSPRTQLPASSGSTPQSTIFGMAKQVGPGFFVARPGDDQVATGQGKSSAPSSHPQPSTTPVTTGPGQGPALSSHPQPPVSPGCTSQSKFFGMPGPFDAPFEDDQVATGQGKGPAPLSRPQPSTSPVTTGPGQSPALSPCPQPSASSGSTPQSGCFGMPGPFGARFVDDQVATGQGKSPAPSSRPQPSISPVTTEPGQGPSLLFRPQPSVSSGSTPQSKTSGMPGQVKPENPAKPSTSPVATGPGPRPALPSRPQPSVSSGSNPQSKNSGTPAQVKPENPAM